MFNVPFREDGVPLPHPGEFFALRRDGIALKLKVGSHTFSGKGCLHLTSIRMVFILYKDQPGVQSLEIPLHLMHGEAFKQPIFGANYLAGRMASLEHPTIPAARGEADFRLTFTEGGTGTFIHYFIRILEAVRRVQRQYAGQAVPPPPPPTPSSGVAFVDPSDPSKIYVSQPAAPPPSAAPPQGGTYYYAVPQSEYGAGAGGMGTTATAGPAAPPYRAAPAGPGYPQQQPPPGGYAAAPAAPGYAPTTPAAAAYTAAPAAPGYSSGAYPAGAAPPYYPPGSVPAAAPAGAAAHGGAGYPAAPPYAAHQAWAPGAAAAYPPSSHAGGSGGGGGGGGGGGWM